MKILKLVTSVEIYPINGKVNANWVAVDSITFPVVDWLDLCIKQHPTLTLSDEIDTKVRLYSAELQLYTPQSIDLSRPYIWKVGLIDGTFRVIGDGNRPYPVATLTETAPESVTENQLYSIKVTYTSDKKIPYI